MRQVCLALAVAAVPAAALAGEVKASPGGRAIPDSYIVVLRETAVGAPVATMALDLASRHGGRVGHLYQRALRGFAVRMPEAAARRLADDPRVEYVEEDSVASTDATQWEASWGLDRTDQRALPLDGAYTYEVTGAGVNAYVVDTGVRATHGEFAGRVRHAFTAINDGRGSGDCHGHGTHVAGTIGGSTWGVAKGVTLWAVRVLDCNGQGAMSGVIAGVDWITANHAKPAVANMSLGGSASQALDDAIARSVAAGVTYAVAAGNQAADACAYSPARAAPALTVGATTSTDRRASFSNWGPCVDVFAPGEAITSAYHTADTAVVNMSGTSMASPHVAGIAALHLQRDPAASAATISAAIVAGATLDQVIDAGSGSPNRLLHSAFGAPPAPPPPPCTDCDHYAGSLSGAGDYDLQPTGGEFASAVAATHRGWLRGPSNANFNLYLQKLEGGYWMNVAAGEAAGSSEDVVYEGQPGRYRWVPYANGGSGAYDLYVRSDAASPLPPSDGPCTGCDHYAGTLSHAGDYDFMPTGGSYYSGVAATHEGWLRGPAGVNFNLYLQKQEGGYWINVAAGEGPGSSEDVVYSGGPGYYRWVPYCNGGSGEYDLYLRSGSSSAPPPAPGAPCTDCDHYADSLSFAGDYDFMPAGGSFYSATASTLRGWLRGPAGVNFNLYLQKQEGGYWINVAGGEGPGSSEDVVYSAGPGYYRWVPYCNGGSGGYDFWKSR